MITTTDIYTTCLIPPLLQAHMIRTTKTGLWIVHHWTGATIDDWLYLHALLVHDLGNLVKFDLSNTAKTKLLPLESLPYWQEVQTKLKKRYGLVADEVTVALITDLKLPRHQEIIELLTGHAPDKLAAAAAGSNWEQKLLDYTDFRIGPFGVVSLDERFADLTKRYAYRTTEWNNPLWVQSQLALFKTIESQIQTQVSTTLTELTDHALLQWSDQDVLAIPW